jgi:hypothetical protein
MTRYDPFDPPAARRSWPVRFAVVRSVWRRWFGPLHASRQVRVDALGFLWYKWPKRIAGKSA